jgi:hypothetical protein
MKKLLWWLPVLAVVGFGVGSRATARPDDDFVGQMRTTPLAPPPSGLPAGVQPDRLPTPGRGGAPAPTPIPNPYPLPTNGKPWMICAATYLGLDGAELARQLVVELRTKHKLSAYIYNRGDEERRSQEQEWQERLKNAHGAPIKRKGPRVLDQFAVLIDGFPDLPSGTAYLPKVKALPMPTLTLESRKNPYDTMLTQELDHQKKQMITRRTNVNPFHNAMVVRNPALGTTAVIRSKYDPFWKELNANESHCVLDNPKKYTLLVKEYTGARVIQTGMQTSGFLSALGMGNAKGNTLDAAAMQARELVRVLRSPQLGFQAWVLHTRLASVVFIGGFDGLEDPELQRLNRQLTSLKFSTKQGGADPIGLMIQNPIFVEVPRP